MYICLCHADKLPNVKMRRLYIFAPGHYWYQRFVYSCTHGYVSCSPIGRRYYRTGTTCKVSTYVVCDVMIPHHLCIPVILICTVCLSQYLGQNKLFQLRVSFNQAFSLQPKFDLARCTTSDCMDFRIRSTFRKPRLAN